MMARKATTLDDLETLTKMSYIESGTHDAALTDKQESRALHERYR